MAVPVCPDCNVRMHKRRSKHGVFWACPNYPECDIVVGAHQDTEEPLGIPATKAVREWRIKAHDEFDKLWKNRDMSRSEAYLWLTRQMKLGKEAHIAEMDVTMCRKVIGLCKLKNPNQKKERKE